MCKHENKEFDNRINEWWCPRCKCFPFAKDSKEKREWFKSVIKQEFQDFCRGSENGWTPRSVRFEMLQRKKEIDESQLTKEPTAQG